MTDNDKLQPTEPPGQFGFLRENLLQWVDNSEVRSGLAIRLRVSGGMPSQSYFFNFSVSGSGEAQIELRDALKARESKREALFLKPEELQPLLRVILSSGILDLQPEPPRFLPDSVVGYLEISDGKEVYQAYFAADEAQAQVQNKTLPPELDKVISMIYELGGRLLDTDSVKP